MSVPLDRLYNFLHDHCDRDVIIYHFYPHGSKKPENIQLLKREQKFTDAEYLNVPVLFHDQEPLQFSEWAEIPKAFKISNYPHSKLKIKTNRFNLHDKLILVHSELNSNEVDKFAKDGAVPVYYWCHAIIAHDWFRYANHDRALDQKTVEAKFLIYNRAWQGSREYRLKFAELLVNNNLQFDCITSFNPTDNAEHYTQHTFCNQLFAPVRHDIEQHLLLNVAPSYASAEYNASDYQKTDIEIVLETLFDDSRWHLTEKSLRPIATGQPFILCATPGSLKYLQRYGFKTFSECWDESYDTVQDPIQRLEAVIKLMTNIKDIDLTRAREIAKHNQRHFFSKEFLSQIIEEFQTNMHDAILETKKYQHGAYLLRNCKMSPNFARSVPAGVAEYVQTLTTKQAK